MSTVIRFPNPTFPAEAVAGPNNPFPVTSSATYPMAVAFNWREVR